MEAMACGCAIIASDVGETYRIVSDEVGYRVSLNVKTITEKLLLMLKNFDLTKTMGMRAREKVMKEHNVDVYSDYLEKLYSEAFLNTKVNNLISSNHN